jgi:mevalonate kinase
MAINESDTVQILGSAPAKIILFGEHAVVYGQPALGFALSRGVKIKIRKGEGRVNTRFSTDLHSAVENTHSSPIPMIRKALGDDFDELDVDLTFEVPLSAGLGSSAALAVALIRAQATLHQEQLSPEDMLARALTVEDVAHGKSSGLDPAISLHGGLISYQRFEDHSAVESINLLHSFHMVIGAYGNHGGTITRVRAVAELKAHAPEPIGAALETLGRSARWGIESLRTGQWEQAGLAMDLAHGVLSGLGLVGNTVETLVRVARHEGAYGAKMSGSGGDGGALVALVPDIQTGNAIATQWRNAGAETWIETAS